MVGWLVKSIGKNAVRRGFLLGVGTTVAAGALAPVLERVVKPAARAVVKEGLRVADQAKVKREELKEVMEDLVAEARHELEAESATVKGTTSKSSAD